ncbi:MAG: sulfurtransferase [Deltaproteobacteria bacterium]|nr:MAG: sulfurtransferase [Deltaproteobacteria bacterium]
MQMELIIRAIAGTVILVSVLLGWLHSPYWYLFTAFVGLNLLQSAFTRWCLMEDLLHKVFGIPKPDQR